MANLESPLYKEVHKIGLLTTLALSTSGIVRVEFYPDRFSILAGKKRKDFPYSGIKRVWKGRYRFSPRGSKVYVEDFPGSKTVAKTVGQLKDERQVQEMLVTNSATRIQVGHEVPLILERHGHDRVDILHAQNEAAVFEIFKTYAPHIERSPVSGV